VVSRGHFQCGSTVVFSVVFSSMSYRKQRTVSQFSPQRKPTFGHTQIRTGGLRGSRVNTRVTSRDRNESIVDPCAILISRPSREELRAGKPTCFSAIQDDPGCNRRGCTLSKYRVTWQVVDITCCGGSYQTTTSRNSQASYARRSPGIAKHCDDQPREVADVMDQRGDLLIVVGSGVNCPNQII
jgi:hypothetical protein